MKNLIILLLFSVLLLVTDLYQLIINHSKSDDLIQFQLWMQKYGKIYHDERQKLYRYGVYLINRQKVIKHNKLMQQGYYSYKKGINFYSDFTVQQFSSKLSFKYENSSYNANVTKSCTGIVNDTPNPPQSVNWTQKAVDKNVYQQGQCKANWAFSAVAAIQGLHRLKMSKLVKLSDQQVIDCSGAYGNEGCGGGFMEQAFWYVIDFGIATNANYKYTGINQTCKYVPAQKFTNITKCARVPSGNYSKLLSAVIQQPVSVSIDSRNFKDYESGIFDGQCGTQIDRGMLLVGYGQNKNSSFWILKNSLGAQWGEHGYIRLQKLEQDGAGKCGIQLAASVPQGIHDD